MPTEKTSEREEDKDLIVKLRGTQSKLNEIRAIKLMAIVNRNGILDFDEPVAVGHDESSLRDSLENIEPEDDDIYYVFEVTKPVSIIQINSTIKVTKLGELDEEKVKVDK